MDELNNPCVYTILAWVVVGLAVDLYHIWQGRRGTDEPTTAPLRLHHRP